MTGIVARRGIGLDPLASFVAVDAGHHHIQEDQVRLAVRRCNERIFTALRSDGPITGGGKFLLEQVDV